MSWYLVLKRKPRQSPGSKPTGRMSIIFRVKLSGWILFVVRKQNAGMAAEINLPESRRRPLAESAAEFIVRTVMASPGEITLVVLGPMTNIALALALEPDLPRNVKRVVAMGGVLQVMGNVSPVASANILGDAHAADIVLGTPWDVILVPAVVEHADFLRISVLSTREGPGTGARRQGHSHRRGDDGQRD